ncbi:hypothetical protein DINM_005815 [Dirofilaria immitis]|nr:hypothetical protein [Dirofilaria immitis]
MRCGLSIEEPRDRASEGIWTGTETPTIYNMKTKVSRIIGTILTASPGGNTSEIHQKARVVFDASAKTNEGLSLNERLYKETAIKHGITMFNKNPLQARQGP